VSEAISKPITMVAKKVYHFVQSWLDRFNGLIQVSGKWDIDIQRYPHIATKMNLMQPFVNILNIEQQWIQKLIPMGLSLCTQKGPDNSSIIKRSSRSLIRFCTNLCNSAEMPIFSKSWVRVARMTLSKALTIHNATAIYPW